MSSGLSGLSDADLMAQLQAARGNSGGPPLAPRPPAPAARSNGGGRPSDLTSLSDEALMGQIAAARGGGGSDPGALKIRVGRQQVPESGPAFDERYGDGPMASTADTSSGLGQDMRRVADERLVGPPSATNARDAAIFNFANAAGLNVPRNMMAGAEALRSGKGFGESYRYVEDVEGALSRQYPKTALGATVGGIVGGAVALPAIPAAQGAGFLGRALANVSTGAAYGGAAEAFDKKTLGDFGTGAAIGGVLGGAGGAAFEGVAKVIGRFRANKVPYRSEDGQLPGQASEALRGAGIDPTDLTPELEARLMAGFDVKGPSPAVAREALAADQGITLSQGQATLDPRAVAIEQGALGGGRGGRAQEIGQEFATRQSREIDAARGQLQSMAARGGPMIDNTQQAFEAAADRARLASDDAAGRAVAAQRAQDDALRAVQGPVPVDTLDGATAAVQGAREAAERGRGAYREAYGEVGKIPGSFAPGALDRMGARVRSRLGPEVPIDDVLTPAASRALADLDDLPGLFGLQPGEGPNLQQVEQLRKRLVSYYGSTGQNPTDKRALGRVIDGLDQHVEDAMSVGLFGDHAGASVSRIADDFPGTAGRLADDVPPPGAIALPEASRGEPESLVRYLARNGGIPLDPEAQAADLNRLYVPGAGTLARRNAPSWDDLRVRLTEAGFFPYGGLDDVSARDVADTVRDMIRAERQGRPTFRIDDEARAGSRRSGERVADENDDFAAQVDRQARRLTIDFEGYGLRPQDLDRAALRDAAEAVVRGETDDAIGAYDRAVMRQETAPRTAAAGEAPPFPDLGDGVSRASSPSLPIGDTAPAEAMRSARGLFREYKQAFSPRGPGDMAGQRLQKIVERDASPNDAITALFGTTTGRIASGQLQTLERLRSAVGTDSDAWSAVQQAIITRYVGGAPRDLPQRLDYLLRGEGRDLAGRFLTDEQRQGLGRLRAAVTQTERAQQAAPAWVQSLERHGFDPNAIAASLFGSGVPGARVGAVNEARAAKSFLGEASPEWAGLRQAAVQRLTEPTMKADKIVERVRAFTDGPGSGVAREMFSAEELSQFRRFAAALNATILPNGKMRPNSEGAAGVVARALDVLAGAVAFKVGGPAAAGATYGMRPAQRLLTGGVSASRARRSFEGGAPRVRPTGPMASTGQLAVGSGLSIGDAR